MKKVLFIGFAGLMGLASCSDDTFVGDQNLLNQNQEGAILFQASRGAMTRADIGGATAAGMLGNHFLVEGTKGTETTFPSDGVVFDNYLVTYTANTAGTTESNTHNWEYVGVTAEATHFPAATLSGLSRGVDQQSIKYWDYSKPQYDFIAYSVGNAVAQTTAPTATNQVKVTKIATGSALNTNAFQFEAKDAATLQQCYITDIKTVETSNYGKPVVLKFKNLAAKARVAVYETVPGYSVKNVEFYADNLDYTYSLTTAAHADVLTQDYYASGHTGGTDSPEHPKGTLWSTVSSTTLYESDGTTTVASPAHADCVTQDYWNENGTTQYTANTTTWVDGTKYYSRAAHALASGATLFTESTFPESGTVTVMYPITGTSNHGKKGYNMAQVSIVPGSETSTTKEFGTFNIATKQEKEHKEDDETASTDAAKLYIGRQSNEATFAGETASNYYQPVVPNSTGATLILRCNYTLVSTDGSKEEIKVWGAKAIVPAIYAQWQSNYAYTYVFKISDKTNGKTDGLLGTNPEGLFPITFDAVVAEMTDADGEQTTITTVEMPSITTYQNGHAYNDGNEYLATKGDIYVMVKKADATLADDLNTKGQLYTVTTSGAAISEATVADALTLQKKNDVSTVTGRNKVLLTKTTSDATITTIPGVTGSNVTITAHTAAKFTPTASKTYAYVYTVTDPAASPEVVYQPVATSVGSTQIEGLFPLAKSTVTAETTKTAASAHAVADHVYFAISTNGSGVKTYTFVQTKVGQDIAEGLVDVDMSSVGAAGTGTAAADTYYFDKYNNYGGSYAVKVINVQ